MLRGKDIGYFAFTRFWIRGRRVLRRAGLESRTCNAFRSAPQTKRRAEPESYLLSKRNGNRDALRSGPIQSRRAVQPKGFTPSLQRAGQLSSGVIRQPAVSQHLAVLKKAGRVRCFPNFQQAQVCGAVAAHG